MNLKRCQLVVNNKNTAMFQYSQHSQHITPTGFIFTENIYTFTYIFNIRYKETYNQSTSLFNEKI